MKLFKQTYIVFLVILAACMLLLGEFLVWLGGFSDIVVRYYNFVAKVQKSYDEEYNNG